MNSPQEPFNQAAENDAPPANWREALADLVSARAALVEIEAREVAKRASQKGIAVGVLLGALFFTWALLLAGGIGLLAAKLEISWGWIALAAALLHGIAAALAVVKLRAPSPPSFSITRSEFERDREWFKNL